MKEKVLTPTLVVNLIGIFFVVAGLAINPLKITRSFFSDEAVYYTMAYSFAIDGDMEFQQKDLVRVYREFAAGPTGIVLKINNRDKTIVFGKAFLYSLVASPFIRFFGTRGFFILHALLLWLNLLSATWFCLRFMKPIAAVLFSIFYFLANASLVYLFWMTPEYFNMSLICYAVFFFVAGETLNSEIKLLRPPFNYIISAVLFAMATYSKPTNALLIVPLGIWMLYRKKVMQAMITASVFVLVTVGLFGMNVYFTGEWNYQLGQRSVFMTNFPYGRAGASPFAPFTQRKVIPAVQRPPFVAKAFLYNWGYFFFGRFSGLAVYFFPMFFVLLYYLFGKKTSLATAVYFSGWVGVLTYMVGIPWNYFGGSGTIGNRYLLNAFAVLPFAMTQEPSRKWITAGFVGSLAFTSVFLFTPVKSSFDNSFHQKGSVFMHLPIERTLLADLPINTNVLARRIAFDDNPTYLLYFMDDKTFFKEAFEHQYGFWVKGGSTTEVIIRAFQEVRLLHVMIRSVKRPNEITVDTGEQTVRIDIQQPGFYEGNIKLPSPLPYDRDDTGPTYLYKVRIRTESGVISRMGGLERYLGAFVRFVLPEAVALPPPQQREEPAQID